MKTGCRYTRAIKQSMNKLFESRSSVHFQLADIISAYSHHTNLKTGSEMVGILPDAHYDSLHQYYCQYGFFIVEQILSHHWCLGYFCPPMMDLRTGICPDHKRRGATEKKRIFNTFMVPMIKRRAKLYLIANEPLQNIPFVYN